MKAWNEARGRNRAARLAAATVVGLLVVSSAATPAAATAQPVIDVMGGSCNVIGPDGGWWLASEVTYRIENSTSDPGASANQRAAIIAAVEAWDSASGADLVPTTGTADIRISFGTGNHGDNFPFDGVGGTYAHAYYPPPTQDGSISGDIHFDDAENWTTSTRPNGTPPIDLQTVALHEVGHALGLPHTTDTNAVMYGCYNGSKRSLTQGDISKVRSKYGSP
jgi:predicted Zn-dependent protease